MVPRHVQQHPRGESLRGGSLRATGSFFVSGIFEASSPTHTAEDAFANETVHGTSDTTNASLEVPQAVQSARSAAPPPPPPELSLNELPTRTAQLTKSPLANAASRLTLGGVSYNGSGRASDQQLSDFTPPLPMPLSPENMSSAAGAYDVQCISDSKVVASGGQPPKHSSENSAPAVASALLQRTAPRHTLRGHASGDSGSANGLAAPALRRVDTASELARGHGIMQPVASWGSFSLLASSPASSPSASYVNLTALGRTGATRGLDVHSRDNADASMNATVGRAARTRGSNNSEQDQLALTSAEVAAVASVGLAMSSNAKLLLVVTDSGHTVAIAAKYKPRMPIVSLVVPTVIRTSGMTWRIKVCVQKIGQPCCGPGCALDS
jgi:hypothetical protein